VACSIKKMMATTSVVVEAMAALHAMMVGKEIGAMNIIFEGDALQIVNAVNDPLQCDSSFGHFVEDVKWVLWSFNSYVFQHVGREANYAAHGIAKEACNHVTETVWWHSIPSFIDGVVGKEVVLSSN
jgi:ribonuclease HI